MNDSREPGQVTRWPLIIAALLLLAGGGVMYFVMRPAPKPPASDGAPTATGGRAITRDDLLAGPEARFTWNREPRADVYRIEVYDLASHLLTAAVLRDTSVLASALLPDSAQAGIWTVVPVSPGGTELPPSPPARFHRP